MSMRTYSLLERNAAQKPDLEAVVCGARRPTYSQLKRLVDRQAKALLANGIKPGNRVAYWGGASLEFWVSFLATTAIGAVWMGLSPKYSRSELAYVIRDAQPKLLMHASLSDNEQRLLLDQLVKEADSIEKNIAVVTDEGEWDVDVDVDFTAAVNGVTEDAAALIIYTSGSTGKPKGAVLSHYGLVYGALVQQQKFAVDPFKTVCAFPINHIACVGDICMTALAAQGCVIFQERFAPELQAQAIAQEKITLWAGVPSMLQICLDSPAFAALDMSHLQLVAWGGAALPNKFIALLKSKNLRLMAVYGMTETTANTCRTAADATVSILSKSIGRPDLEFPARVVAESGELADVGATGELQFKGKFLFLNYFNNPDATEAAFTDDGWFKTGDLVRMHSDGNLELVGRLKEMFKSGGYNVYPREVELAIEALPGVVMAAVIAVPDEKFQEVGKAFVQLHPGATIGREKLKEALRERLANYKIPKDFIIVEQLPMLPVGKIDKGALRSLVTQ